MAFDILKYLPEMKILTPMTIWINAVLKDSQEANIMSVILWYKFLLIMMNIRTGA